MLIKPAFNIILDEFDKGLMNDNQCKCSYNHMVINEEIAERTYHDVIILFLYFIEWWPHN